MNVGEQFVKYAFLLTDGFSDWLEHPNFLSCVINETRECVYVRILRTPDKPITLKPSDFAVIAEQVNKLQTVFRVTCGHVSYGMPAGGTLQFAYEELNVANATEEKVEQ